MSRIVVVEDEPAVRQIICEWLTGEGYEVEGFATAEKALDWFAETPLMPDAALLDIKLPGMNGFALADRLAVDHHFDRVIFITAFFWEEETRAQMAARRKPYFEKPLKFQVEVLPFLERYLKARA